MITKKTEIKIALIGNPNCGKTSLFNGLVGTHLKVGNFAGVTIEKYEGYLRYKGVTFRFMDLPGIYSMTAYSPEEIITRNYLIEEKPDIVVNVLDGTNLQRNLYLTTQLMEMNTNVVIALNMIDEVDKQGIQIDFQQLELLLGCAIVPTNSIKKEGFSKLLDAILQYKNTPQLQNKLVYSTEIEMALESLKLILSEDKELMTQYSDHWLAIKLLENDQYVFSILKDRYIWIRLEKKILEIFAILEKQVAVPLSLRLTEERYAFINGALLETVKYPKIQLKTMTDYLDAILIHRVLGLPIFFGLMWIVFQLTFKLGRIPMGWIEHLFDLLSRMTNLFLPSGILQSVIVDGMIAGVGGVLVFLPNIAILFLAIAILEGTGYMARVAFIIDKILHLVGLHGKSFIPMVSGFGCSVPALMACRTLKNKADRITTMMIIPFMSCGAKLPVYVLLISAFFSMKMAGNILFGIYFFGIVIAIISAKILKTVLFKNESEPFVMELPPYRMPTIKSLIVYVWIRVWLYLKKAGTLILMISILVWFASNFPKSQKINHLYNLQIKEVISKTNPGITQKEKIQMIENNRRADQIKVSIAGRIGQAIEPVIKPIGFDWKIGVGLVSGLAAKEVVVSTLSTIYALGDSSGTNELAKTLQKDPHYNQATALSLMVFVLLYLPCISATSVFHREAGSWKWTSIYIAYSIGVAWLASFAVYHIAMVFS